MKIKKKIIIPITLLLLVGGIWIMTGDSGADDEHYRTAEVTRGDIAEVVTANGTLNPMEQVSVGTQVSGKIDNIYVKLNDQVKKGQLLAEIDPSIPASALKQSKAALETSRNAYELSRRNLERKRTLYQKNYISKVELEGEEQSFLSSKNAYENAQTQVERDTVNLGYTKITSPIDGLIISQEVAQGQTMAANFQTPNLFRIASDLSIMKIDVAFAEADISKINVGLPVTFMVDAFPDRIFNGRVETVNLSPLNQGGVVTYSVTVAVTNEDRALLPGMTAFVSVILSERKGVLRVPAAALRFSPPEQRVGGLNRILQFGVRAPRRQNNDYGKQMVHILKDNVPVPIEVQVGSTDETYVEVVADGLKEGDTVITGIMPSQKR